MEPHHLQRGNAGNIGRQLNLHEFYSIGGTSLRKDIHFKDFDAFHAVFCDNVIVSAEWQ